MDVGTVNNHVWPDDNSLLARAHGQATNSNFRNASLLPKWILDLVLAVLALGISGVWKGIRTPMQCKCVTSKCSTARCELNTSGSPHNNWYAHLYFFPSFNLSGGLRSSLSHFEFPLFGGCLWQECVFPPWSFPSHPSVLQKCKAAPLNLQPHKELSPGLCDVSFLSASLIY